MSSLFRRKLDELEDMFITSQDDLLARFTSTYEENNRLKAEVERLQDFNDGLMSMRWMDEKGNLLTAGDYNRMKAEIERLTKELEHERSSVRVVSIGEVQEAVNKMPGACKHTEHPLMPCIDCIGAMMRSDDDEGKTKP